MERRSGIVTLTTDFGTRDAYVGAMKGVLCSILPEVSIVDITHEIRPQKIIEAAYLLSTVYPWFPPGTVHVVVVDPGVGTKRRPLAVSADGQLFVGPDNGVLSAPLSGRGVVAHLIEEVDYELPERSDTFHGRDVFAPAAGHLASGVSIERLGPRVEDFLIEELPRAVVADGCICGEVLRIDRFGNALTNIPRSMLIEIGSGPYHVTGADRDYGILQRVFQDVPEGETIALIGGDGRVEIAVNGDSAATELGLEPGDKIEIRGTS